MCDVAHKSLSQFNGNEKAFDNPSALPSSMARVLPCLFLNLLHVVNLD